MSVLRNICGVCLPVIVAAACGSSPSDDDGASDSSAAGNGSATSGGATVTGGLTQGAAAGSTSGGVQSAAAGSTTGGVATTGGINSAVDGCAGPDLNGCVGSNYEGEGLPLAIYIMFDQSASMDCVIEATQPWQNSQCNGNNPRITPVREAVDLFLNDPASAGIYAGISYFGFMSIGNTSCNANDYSNPAVEIGELPSNAALLTGSLYAVNPTGETPTGAAIRGACSHMTAWHQQNPGFKKVILLVTDGVPEAPASNGCNPSIDDAAQAAADCLASDVGIETYVLGVGQALSNLTQIAQAGGTEQAYLVEGGNVSQSVLEALNAIRADAAIPCTLPVPTPATGMVNYSSVNLGICDPAGNSLSTYYVGDVGSCADAGGWYYTNGGATQNIQLCDATCSIVSSAGSKLFFTLGCDTIDVPPVE